MMGPRLAQERRRLKLSQRQLGDLLGISRSAVGMIETGRVAIDVERLLQLGESGIDVLRLLTNEPGNVAAGRMLDWSLCTEIYQRVDAYALDCGIPLSAEKRAIVGKHLYIQFSARGLFDESTLREAVEMAA